MMKDDQFDDERPLKIVAGLAALTLVGAWLMTSLDTPASTDATGAGAAPRTQTSVPFAPATGTRAARTAQGTTVADQDSQGPGNTQGRPGGDTRVSPRVAQALSDVIELLNADKFAEATAAIEPLLTSEMLSSMTPFERSRLYQLSFNLNMKDENYEAAQADLQAAIESGGLNAEEMSQMTYQRAQLFLQMEDYAKAADSLELWIADEPAPNPGAYYLLAASYYYQDKFDDARDHMETLFSMPGEKQEGWYAMLNSLYLRNEDYARALPVTREMVERYGDNRMYQKQLAGLYLQTEDYENARTVLEKMVAQFGEEQDRAQLNDLNRFLGNAP